MQEAIAWTVDRNLAQRNRALQAEIDLLREELAFVRAELGADADIAPIMVALSLTRTSAIIAKALLDRQSVSRASMAVILWQDWRRDPKSLDVMIYNLRKALLPFGVTIETMWSVGWRMTPLSKSRMKEAIQ